MSSKYNHQTSFKVEAFYKGLEELEAELDPKQIEKLIIFLEVIRTQEKFSKVLPLLAVLVILMTYDTTFVVTAHKLYNLFQTLSAQTPTSP